MFGLKIKIVALEVMTRRSVLWALHDRDKCPTEMGSEDWFHAYGPLVHSRTEKYFIVIMLHT